jgi:hypothetical protein
MSVLSVRSRGHPVGRGTMLRANIDESGIFCMTHLFSHSDGIPPQIVTHSTMDMGVGCHFNNQWQGSLKAAPHISTLLHMKNLCTLLALQWWLAVPFESCFENTPCVCCLWSLPRGQEPSAPHRIKKRLESFIQKVLKSHEKNKNTSSSPDDQFV